MSNAYSKLRLRRVSPLGSGLILACASLLLSAIAVIALLVRMATDSSAAGGQTDRAESIGMMIGIAIVYPIMGFIGGALYAVIFNVIAPMIGGLELTVSGLSSESEQVWDDV